MFTYQVPVVKFGTPRPGSLIDKSLVDPTELVDSKTAAELVKSPAQGDNATVRNARCDPTPSVCESSAVNAPTVLEDALTSSRMMYVFPVPNKFDEPTCL